mgnify:CR=1 FL=1
MREITNEEWNSLVMNFQENQFYDNTLRVCLENFIFDYAVLMEKAKKEEGMEVDFQQDTNTKINNLWDYIFNLEKQVKDLQTVDFHTQEVDPRYKQKGITTTNLTYNGETWTGKY